jgi:mannose-6-phosphate isomerase-like protein (cupin superfamily)
VGDWQVIHMRLWFVIALAISAAPALQSEIHDVLKSAEIETGLAKAKGSLTIHQRPNFSISLHSKEGAASPPETHDDADEVLFIRRGSGSLWLESRRYEIGGGDVINVRRKTAHRIDVSAGRIEYVAVRIFPTGEGHPASGIRPAPRTMPDVLRASEINETFAKFDTNQPIHSAPNFTMNYVIYSGRVGPWEAHHGCVDIYFLKIGTAVAQLGGHIADAKEESPGEPRGSGVTGARRHEIGPGDIVLIPRDTAHHMDPGAGKLGYLLMKIWAE